MKRISIGFIFHFREHLSLQEVEQVILEVEERLRDIETVFKDLFEDDYDCMSISIVKEDLSLEEGVC